MIEAYGSPGKVAFDLLLLIATAGVAAWLLRWRSGRPLPQEVPPSAQTGLHWLRGLMALVVLVEHVRSLLFVGYSELEHPSLLTQGIYFVTAWGSQAVIVFFVLSGYLITRLYAHRLWTGSMGWASFALNRVVRLHLVLLPALALTVACAWVTNSLGQSPALTFFGHVLFLQPIFVELFTNNPPLWSLGFEGMAYVAFTCAMVGLGRLRDRRSDPKTFLPWLVLLAVLAAFGSWFWHYMSLWLLGACAALWDGEGKNAEKLPSAVGRWLFFGSLGLLSLVFIVTRFGAPLAVQDWAVALPTAFCVALFRYVGKAPNETTDTTRAGPSAVGRALSGRAYSLYVLHYPFLALLACQLGTPRARPSFPGLLGSLVASGLLVLLSGGFAFVTERRTQKVRDWLSRRAAQKVPTRPK